MNAPVVRALCALLVTLGAFPARADDPLADIARPLDADQIFYRWQSIESGEGLVKLGTLNAATNARFMGMADKINAGPGLYFAGTPLSSSDYLPDAGGNLIEVIIPRGTRIVDLTDPAITQRLNAAGLGKAIYHDGDHARDGLVLKYSPDWYVGRNLTDRAKFRMYPGPEHSAEDVTLTWRRARVQQKPKVGEQLAKQIARVRPNFIRENYSPAGFEREYITTLTPGELAEDILKHLHFNSTPLVMQNLLGHLTAQPNAAQSIQRERPSAFNRLAEVLVDHFQGEISGLNEAQLHVVTSLAIRASDTAPTRRARLIDLLFRALENSALKAKPAVMAQTVSPLLAQLELTEAESARIADRLRIAVRRASFLTEEAVPLREIATAAKIKDAEVLGGIDALAHRATLIQRVINGGDQQALRAALRGHEDIELLHRTVDRLARTVKDGSIAQTFSELVATHPEEYLGLLRTPSDYYHAVALDSDHSLHLFETTYAAALRTDDARRVQFLRACLFDHRCAKRLDARVAEDHGRIFRRFERPDEVASLLRDVEYRQDDMIGAKRYARFILRGLRDRGAIEQFSAILAAPPGGIDLTPEAARRVRTVERLAARRPRPGESCLSVIDAAER